MTWNHRIILTKEYGETDLAIHEVYYDDAGNITGWTREPVPVHAGDHVEDLQWVLDQMAEALKKPILMIDPNDENNLVELGYANSPHR